MWQPKPAMWAPGIRQGHPLAQGLVGYWPMWEGGGTRVMDVGAGAAGSIVGAAAWEQSVVGRCIELNGSSQYVNIGTPNRLGGAWALSAVALVRPDANDDAEIMAQWSNDAGNRSFLFGKVSNKLRVALQDSSNRIIVIDTISAVVAIGEWALYGFATDSGFSSVLVFVNGTQVATTEVYSESPVPPLKTAIANASLLARYNTGTVTSFWDGAIACAGIWRTQQHSAMFSELSADPWSLIRPRARSYFYAATGAVSSKVPVIMSYLRRRRAA